MKTGLEMQNNRGALQSSQAGRFWLPRRSAFAALAAILVIATSSGPSAFAQGAAVPGAGQAAAPAGAAASPATPPPTAAPTVAAPATAVPTPAPAAPAPAAAAAAPPAPLSATAPTAPTAAAAAAPNAAEPRPGEPTIGRAQLPQDLSPWGMYENADRLVKAVLIGLALASFVTWTVWIAKSFELHRARNQARADLRTLINAATFAQAHEQLRDGTSPVAQLMQAAGQEIRLSASVRGDGLKERIAWQLERLEIAASRKISRGTGVLATIGSTAPFIGLFGTVWGIMNSFIGISNAHTTNLAVVAPGIAQALLATALGLAAAIPAVMIYNVLARSTAHYRALLGDASVQVMRLVSRDLDRAKLPLAQAAE